MKNFLHPFLCVLSFLFFQSTITQGNSAPYYPKEAKEPKNLTEVNGFWYYSANHFSECSYAYDSECISYSKGWELWRSNGTASGTSKISEYSYSINAEESFLAFPDAFIAVDNSLFFIGYRTYNTFDLVKIDNSVTEPALVKTFYHREDPLIINDYNYYFTSLNGLLLFAAGNDESGETAASGTELWRSDGTEEGTVMVKDIFPGESSAYPASFTTGNGLAYFSATDQTGQADWQSDGTEEGTIKVVTTLSCSATGTILSEYYSNIKGTSVSSIPLYKTPTSVSQLTAFETKPNKADNYGERIRGYICAPLTGNYTFYIAGDDNSALYLSTDSDASNKRKIASLKGWTASRQWKKFSSQKSVSISLVAGKKYYVEALHKEGVGGDNLSVGWTLPNSSIIEVISGSYLSAFEPKNSVEAPTARLDLMQNLPTKLKLSAYPNPFEDILQVSLSGAEQGVLTLTDMMGKEYLPEAGSANWQRGELSIDLSRLDLKKGIYLLRLKTAKGMSEAVRVVKR